MNFIRTIFSGLLIGSFITVSLYMGGIGGCGSTAASGTGGGGGGSSGGEETATNPGEASVATLATVPSVDISNLDFSAATTASASVSKLPRMKTKNASSEKKGLGKNYNQVGNPSRAGCEANMHKQEIIRHSQQAQLDRCYAEAMETAGLITIPADTYARYDIHPPEDDEAQRGRMCDGIPEERTEERERCESGDEGPGAEGIKVRVGRFGNELRIDLCEGDGGLVNEATFTADGSVYTIDVTRIGDFNGHEESANFNAIVDLGSTGRVVDGIVDLGDGNVTANSCMDGGFGNGCITFQAIGDDPTLGNYNVVSGIFKGAFREPRSGVKTTFTGKAYSQFGGSSNTGCAKFSFTGAPPPMRVADMVPFDIAEAQLDNFLRTFGVQLGIDLNRNNYRNIMLCNNPDFDPSNPQQGGIPMVVAAAAGCATITHTGVECFSIENGTETGDFGNKVVQVFTIIENTGSTFYTAVNNFDLGTIIDQSPAIAFGRKWDCAGPFDEINFESLDPEKIESELQECLALEEKARGNQGAGDYNCHQQQQQGDIDNFAQEGPPDQGKQGGACKVNGGTCPAERDFFFINPVDPDKGKFCVVTMSGCQEFTLTGTSVTGLNIKEPDGNTITAITFAQPDSTKPATGATVDMVIRGASCQKTCALEQHTFEKPPAFDEQGAKRAAQEQGTGGPQGPGGQPGPGGPRGGPGGPMPNQPPPPDSAGAKNPGQQGFVPQSCINAGLTSESACRAHCERTHDCRQ